MNRAGKTFISNLSNQANMNSAETSELYQLNVVIAIGLEHLGASQQSRLKTPLSISVNRTGELDISGLDGVTVSDEHIRVHADRKVTKSPDQDSK
ncbi:hypothetical protein [Dethiobacter alkaliphilus]|uniref:hypothetical protein n=1 Tax=Dethiobacter alkaliphilus TaxID=427926 RepID=UPI0022277A90|nr:hypothetical protein [Dethiobacter alkaliphilus]MCW3490610.1 hypothetical protein [Dethiobacter alkaliphilus]